MELIDRYTKALSRLDSNEYTSTQRRKRDISLLKNLIKKYDTSNKQSKSYQQAVARFNIDFPDCSYDLQGYIIEEQDKLNEKNK